MRPMSSRDHSTASRSVSKSATTNQQSAIRRVALFFAVGFCVVAMSSVAWGQTATDGDYRSRATAAWSGASTWQVRSAGSWANTATAPTSSNNVYIQSGHTVTVDVTTASCNDLHAHTSGVMAIGANTLQVNGKIRAYTGTAVTTAGADGTFYSGQTSSTSPGAGSITTSTGKLSMVGNSRIGFNSGEWGATLTGAAFEVSLTSGQTLTPGTNAKAKSWVLASGTVDASTAARVISADDGTTGGPVTIQSGATLVSAANPVVQRTGSTSAGSFTVNSGGTLTLTQTSPTIAATTITFSGTVEYSRSGAQTLAVAVQSGGNPNTYTNLKLSGTNAKTLSQNTTINGTLTLAGTASLALSTFTRTYGASSILEYAGSTSQTSTDTELPSTSGPNSLKINNSSGVTLHASRTINGTLTLSSGNITTNANTLTLGSSSTVSRTSGHVIGNLKKTSVPSSFTFDVGTANGYSPLTLSSVSGSGDFTVSATQSTMPGVALPGKALTRYWSLTNAGLTSAVVSFQYLDADIPGTSTEANYRIFKDTNGGGTGFSFPGAGADDVDDSTNTATTLSAVSTFSNWSVAEPNAPTAVKLMSFTATNNNGDVMLQWQSGYEAHNLGYYVYREQNGKRVQITPSLIAGSALTTGLQTVVNGGLAYTWYDEGAKGRGQSAKGEEQKAGVTYWLEDVDLDGTRTLHGPIAPSIGYASPKGRPQRSALLNEVTGKMAGRGPVSGTTFRGWPAVFEAQQAALANPRVVSPDATIQQRQIAAMAGVKLAVSSGGWQRVTQAELVAAGLDPNVNAPQLQLYANGRAIPIKLSGDQVHFSSSDYLEFYGHGIDSPTEAAQTYYLVVKPDSFGSRIGDLIYRDPQPLPPPSGAPSYQYTIERQDRWIYYAALLNGDAGNVFGHIVRGTPVSETLPVSHADASGEDANLEVSLVGVSLQAHHVQVSFNGTNVGTMEFGSAEHTSQSFNVPAALLQSGDNTVQLMALDGDTDTSLVDTVRLTYAHAYVADNNELAVGIDNEETRRLSGFTSANVRVVDITDGRNVLEITPTVVVTAQGDGTYAVDMQVQGASFRQAHTLLAFVDGQAGHPDTIKANEPSSWWSQTAGADYLIISSGEFKTSLEPLAQLRRGQGMVVKVVDVEDVYDEFSFGQHTPQALHDFLQTATTTWTRQPHYVLFGGDASFDPKNYLGQGRTDYVPTKLLDTGLMETASDDWLADFDGDGLAELAIGRLPLRTAADAELMVGKIINYENTAIDPQRGALLVADRDFEAASAAVQSLLPATLPQQVINRSSADDTTIHNQIMSSLNQGPSVVNFMGHGGNGTWTGALLLSIYDAPDLTNNNRLSLYVMMTCMNGYFQNAYNDSLSEALLRTPGGAVAVWSSTGMTDPGGQNLIDQEFYRQIFGGQGAGTRLLPGVKSLRGLSRPQVIRLSPTLGDAARAAKSTTTDPDVRRTWTLFGDPAMRLR